METQQYYYADFFKKKHSKATLTRTALSNMSLKHVHANSDDGRESISNERPGLACGFGGRGPTQY